MFLPRAALGSWSSHWYLPHSWHYKLLNISGLLVEMGVLLTVFAQGWPQTAVLPISSSWTGNWNYRYVLPPCSPAHIFHVVTIGKFLHSIISKFIGLKVWQWPPNFISLYWLKVLVCLLYLGIYYALELCSWRFPQRSTIYLTSFSKVSISATVVHFASSSEETTIVC
jgi:hypothetical protein